MLQLFQVWSQKRLVQRGKKCINCGEKEHSRCEENVRCANCGGLHKATFKGCPDYETNWQLKKIMAEENVSIFEAKEIFKGKLMNTECVDITMTREFPELRQRDPELAGYKYRNEDNGIHDRRTKVSYADLVNRDYESVEREYDRAEKKTAIYDNIKKGHPTPILVNKKVEEDKRGRNFGKIVNSRDEDIPKERYGLAMKTISDHYENKKENLKIEQIEQIIERFMDKNREYMDKFMRAQEQMWKEMDARISNIERKVGIHDLRTRTYEERSEEEGG